MVKETELHSIKSVAEALLYLDIEKTEFAPVIVRHPFTTTGVVMIRDGSGQRMVELDTKEGLCAWREFVKGLIRSAGNLSQIYIMISTPYKLSFVELCAEFLSQVDLQEYLHDAWISSEGMSLGGRQAQKNYICLFKRAGYDGAVDENDKKQYDAFPETLTVYRGVRNSKKTAVKGMSWTTSKGKAEWFAKRYDSHGFVYTAKVPKERILLYTNGRFEKEVIVDPADLMDVRLADAS